MSKGQQAMAVAMMYPEPAKTKRKRSGSLEPKELGISGARIYSAASAGVSLTFINPASSVVLGYDLDLGSSAKLDFRLFFNQGLPRRNTRGRVSWSRMHKK
jgi:hypothetical protein